MANTTLFDNSHETCKRPLLAEVLQRIRPTYSGEELNARYGVRVVRVDSGGTLNGVLLRAGLVDEVSVLISPFLVGGTTPRSLFRATDLASAEGVVGLKLVHLERVRDDIVWLRYEVLVRR